MALLLLLLLCWTCSCPVLADQATPCHLYTVNKTERRRWEVRDSRYLLSLAPVFIQGEGSAGGRVSLASSSQLSVDDVPCLVYISHKKTTQQEPNCVLNVSSEEEVVGVEVRVMEGRVLVSREGSSEWKEATNSNNTHAITVTTDGTLNVAFNCPQRCFQFSDAIIGKNVTDPGYGSVTFYGRPTTHVTSHSQFGMIYLLYGKNGWTNQLNLAVKNDHLDDNNWTKFNVTGHFIKTADDCSGGYKMSFSYYIGSQLVRDGGGDSARCVTGPSFILQFNNTSNMEWALCKPPEGSTGAVVPVVVCVVMVALVVVLVVTCVVIRCTRKQHSTTQTKGSGDADNHVGDQVVLTQLRGDGVKQGRPRVISENSLYGCVIAGLD